MYGLFVKPSADRIFRKLSRKDSKQLEIIHKKISEIRQDPHHGYKFLRAPLQGFNRVHIDTHFVLVFRILHEHQLVEIWAYEHHDDVYKGRWL